MWARVTANHLFAKKLIQKITPIVGIDSQLHLLSGLDSMLSGHCQPHASNGGVKDSRSGRILDMDILHIFFREKLVEPGSC